MYGLLMQGLNMCAHHPKLSRFIEMKLEYLSPSESAEVLEALATTQDPPTTSVQK